MSAGTGQEWVYVDLGVSSTFDSIKLFWINKALKGSIQVSDDAKTWTDMASLPGDASLVDKVGQGRFVFFAVKWISISLACQILKMNQ